MPFIAAIGSLLAVPLFATLTVLLWPLFAALGLPL